MYVRECVRGANRVLFMNPVAACASRWMFTEPTPPCGHPFLLRQGYEGRAKEGISLVGPRSELPRHEGRSDNDTGVLALPFVLSS